MKHIKLFEDFINISFSEWFDNSCVVDNYDNPLIVYHGSDIQFEDFELSKNIKLYGSLFFTDNIKMAKSYGKFIYKAYLKIEDPYYYDAYGETFNNISEIIDSLAFRLGGGDGVIIKNIKDSKSGKDNRFKPSSIYIVRDLDQIYKIN